MTNIQMQKVKVMVSEMNIDELRNLSNYINLMFKSQQVSAAKSFCKGDTVSFVTKSGTKIVGTVEKINQKSVSVVTKTSGNWKVSGSLLTLVK